MGAPAEPPLIGRDRELAELRALLTRAKKHERGAVLVEGEAGIGKTRLISEAVRISDEIGFTTFYASTDESDQSRTYGVLIEAFSGDAGRRRDLEERLGRAAQTAPDRRLAVIDEFVSIVEATSNGAPVALVLDDLHWADVETLSVLRALVRRSARTLPLAFIGATRPSPDNVELSQLAETVTETAGKHVVLGPLGDDAVRSLTDRVVSGEPSSELRRRVESAGGNPFFVMEVISAGIDEQTGAELPRDLRRTLLRRIAHLSDDAKTIVRLASVLGPSVETDELEAVVGRASHEIVPLLDEAIDGGVLERSNGMLIFRHDLVRQAVYDDMPSPVRNGAHRDVARRLAARGAPARRVATHFANAAQPGDDEAVSWLRRAAAEESPRSPTVAADMLGQAANLLTEADPKRDRIDAERAQMLAWSGRVTEASALATDVLSRLDDPQLAAEVQASLGESLLMCGRLMEAAGHLEGAAPEAPIDRRGLIYSAAGLARQVSGQLERAEELCDKALSSTDDVRARSLATAVKGIVAHVRGDPSAVPVCRAAVHLADQDATGEAHRYGIRFFLGFALSEADSDDEAVAVLRKGIRLDEAHGVAWALPTYHSALGALYFVRGEWDDAVAELEVAEQLLEDMDSAILGPLTHGLLAYIAARRDDQAEAERQLALGDADLAVAGPQVGVDWMIRTRAALAEDTGDIGTAVAILGAGWGMSQAMGFHVAFRFFGPTYIRLLLAAGDKEGAQRAAEAVELVGRSGRTRAMPAIVALCRGMVEADAGLVIKAVETLRTCRRPLDFAPACEAAAALLGESGEAQHADDLRQEALTMYESMGALRDVRRMADADRVTGDRRKRTKPARPVTGWESLSPTEHRVVALVVVGLSNTAIGERMFISPRTVETHLTHIFRKLGIVSRLELAVQASRALA